MDTAVRRPKKIFRLLPCPFFDVDMMTSWLEDLALEGLFLVPDGICAGIAAFERGTPKAVAYRMAASTHKPGIWNEDAGLRDEDLIAAKEAEGWQFRARWENLYLFALDDGAAAAGEDAHLRLTALRSLQRHTRSSLLPTLFWLALLFLLFYQDGAMISYLSEMPWLAALLLVEVLWSIYRPVVQLVRLRGLTRPADGRRLPRRDWRREARWHWAEEIVEWALIFAIILALVLLIGGSLLK